MQLHEVVKRPSIWSFWAPFSLLLTAVFMILVWDYRRFSAVPFEQKEYQTIFWMVTDWKKVGEFLAAPGMVFARSQRWNESTNRVVAEGRVENVTQIGR